LSFSPAKKAIHWMSGDQKGKDASPVPESSCATSELSGRTQRVLLPSTDCAPNARRVPFGDNAKPKVKAAFAGGWMLATIGAGWSTCRWK
jgi:hypothetical protein